MENIVLNRNILAEKADLVEFHELDWYFTSWNVAGLNCRENLQTPLLTQDIHLIIASEIIYLSQLHKKLLNLLKSFMSVGSKPLFLLAFKNRGLGEERFFRLAEKMGFAVEFIQRERIYSEYQQDLDYNVAKLRFNWYKACI